MGYQTDFEGAIAVRPALSDDFVQRWNTATEGTPGKAYVSSSQYGKTDYPDMLPGFEHPDIHHWCNWELEADDDRTLIQWNGGENFCQYDAWLQALVDCILREFPASEFTGEIEWDGEERGDLGKLYVVRNREVKAIKGQVSYAMKGDDDE